MVLLLLIDKLKVFMSNVQLLQKCSVVPPLGNSDHRGIHFKFNGKQSQTIWMSQLKELYGDMHMLTGKKGCEQINATDWNSLLADDVNKSWFNNCHH